MNLLFHFLCFLQRIESVLWDVCCNQRSSNLGQSLYCQLVEYILNIYCMYCIPILFPLSVFPPKYLLIVQRWLQYRFIYKPFHYSWHSNRSFSCYKKYYVYVIFNLNIWNTKLWFFYPSIMCWKFWMSFKYCNQFCRVWRNIKRHINILFLWP